MSLLRISYKKIATFIPPALSHIHVLLFLQKLAAILCCREESILNPCWNCFFDLLYIVFVIIIMHNGLPQRTLPQEEKARIHRRTIQKRSNDTNNHNGVLTHLEPDILECKVKWALGSIPKNKAIGGDGIPAELFQILKYAVKVLHSICQQTWKTQQWPQDWKRSVFIPIPKKGNAKECSNY